MTGPWRCSSRRRAGLALAAATLALVASGAPASAAPADATIVSEQRIDARLRELTIAAPALAAETKVRVLLPNGYRADDGRRYPVLYLLHGAVVGPIGVPARPAAVRHDDDHRPAGGRPRSGAVVGPVGLVAAGAVQ